LATVAQLCGDAGLDLIKLKVFMKHDPNIVYAECASTHGNLYLAATPQGLAGMWFTDQRHLPDVSNWQKRDDINQQQILKETQRQLQAYFAGELKQFDVPLDLSFQQAVWQALLKIPFGQTTSYGALSSSIGKPLAVRAVGTAIGRNPIGIIVPCHRVVGADGSLTGYAGGLHRKEAFLTLESALAGSARSLQGILL
jgi:methylated-DNA-[protein]-cysteine S-methyltransferase